MVRAALAGGVETGRKLVVAVVGGTIVVLGITMVVLPGPAFLVIPLGLGILALEFAWAKRWLRSLEQSSNRLLERLRPSRTA